MAIKFKVICDICGEVIEDTAHTNLGGVAVIGNIHFTDSRKDKGIGGGVVGNNINDSGLPPGVSHYHKLCLTEMLGMRIVLTR